MSGAAFILAVNLLIASLFCATFVAISVYAPRYRSARWFAFAYAMGMIYAVFEFLVPTVSDARIAVFLGHGAFLATLLFLNVGLARRYDLETPRSLLAATTACSLVLVALIADLPRESYMRMFSYQAPFAVMQAIGMTIVLRAPGRHFLDNLLGGLLCVTALHYLAKPLVAMWMGGVGGQPQDYLLTTYAMASQSMGAVLVVATGLLLLSMLIADVIRDVTERSLTDPLSGLLNRRGFEHRLAECIAERSKGGMPVTLVLSDLDHFKKVNDNYGHAVGDRLIVEFAASLRRMSTDHHILARIGGEEFAAVLSGSNLAAGRLFAEAVRATYARAGEAHLGSGVRCSASFGVAEFEPGDTLSSLVERADAALYSAKREGRDLVRVAIPDQGSAPQWRDVTASQRSG